MWRIVCQESEAALRLHETQIGRPEESKEAPGSGLLRLALVIVWSITLLNYAVISLMGQFYGIDIVFQMVPYLTVSILITAIWVITKVYWYFKQKG